MKRLLLLLALLFFCLPSAQALDLNYSWMPSDSNTHTTLLVTTSAKKDVNNIEAQIGDRLYQKKDFLQQRAGEYSLKLANTELLSAKKMVLSATDGNEQTELSIDINAHKETTLEIKAETIKQPDFFLTTPLWKGTVLDVELEVIAWQTLLLFALLVGFVYAMRPT